jgi:hypothetical protein
MAGFGEGVAFFLLDEELQSVAAAKGDLKLAAFIDLASSSSMQRY